MTASHKLKIRTASSNIERLIFFSTIKTDSEFILIFTMWAKHKQSEIQMV